MILEFWVMRVLLHPGPPKRKVSLQSLSASEQVTALAHVKSGALAILPDNSIAEPVQVFEHQLDADAHRELLQEKHPAEDFRVILNTDMPL